MTLVSGARAAGDPDEEPDNDPVDEHGDRPGDQPGGLPVELAAEAPDELSVAPPAAARRPGLREAVVAFRYRNFTLFWLGALLSNSGTWVQSTVVPVVVLAATGSPAWAEFGVFLQLIPMVVVSPLGGAIADRFNRRRVLFVTQSLLAGVALAMWAVFVTGHGSLTALFVLLVVGGALTGLNIPSWQAFVSELVPRPVLLSAVTLNSTQFNAARLFGPVLGGVVLATLGADWAFMINAWSYVAVIAALALLRMPRRSGPAAAASVPDASGGTRSVRRPGILREFAVAARETRRYPGIRACFVAVVALGVANGPLLGLLPVFAHDVFGVGDLAYGLLYGALGLGAVATAPLVAGRGSARGRATLALIAMLGYGSATLAIGAAPGYAVAFIALFVGGGSYLAQASATNTTIQFQVDESIRGKVLALYVMLLTTALPMGALAGAFLVRLVGPRGVMLVAGSVFLGAAAWLWKGSDWLAHMDDEGPLPATVAATP